jgi:hypothetical protein
MTPLAELQSVRFITEPNDAQKKRIGRLNKLDGWDCWLAKIEKREPGLLTAEGLKYISDGRAAYKKSGQQYEEESRRIWEHDAKLGEFAPN